jgi:glycosyltransferase involved in cell wall biosynthesis
VPHGKTGKFAVKTISIITPCFNEAENLQECVDRLRIVMESKASEYDYEHILADNASTDASKEKLIELATRDPRVKVIVNSRNVGPFSNMWNAMKSATGDAVIPMLPADLQDPPEVIPQFIKAWEEGNLIAYGIRASRDESIFLRISRNIYYRLITKFASEVIPRNSGEFLLADRKVIDSVLTLKDEYPYIRGLIAQTGVKSCKISYNWETRKRGKSRNSLLDLVDQAINGFVATSRAPARATLLLGFMCSALGILGAIATFIVFLVNRNDVQVGIPTLMVTGLFFGGLQLLFLGLIGEYVLSIHNQVRPRPPVIEMEKINFSREIKPK